MSSPTRSIFLCGMLLPMLLTVAPAPAEDDPAGVQSLRDRQERLQNLEFAVKEAKLLQQLCTLQPTAPECRSTAAVPNPLADSPSAPHAVHTVPTGYRVVEISGSNGRLQAVLVGPGEARQVVVPGATLAGDITVKRITVDTVVLSQHDEQFTIRTLR